MKSKEESGTLKENKGAEETKPICGLVMPISEIDGCSAQHWQEVLGVLKEAAGNAGYDARLVSESDDVGVIQQRIVQNLYDYDIIVCDVSAKNANVMFELGLRLAFDKPAIVVKDEKTGYSFDTSPIEHLEYPRDLRYSTIQKFKVDLGKKIAATVEASKKPEYTTFLKHFGKFEIAGLETKQISEEEFLHEELRELKVGMKAVFSSLRELQSVGQRPTSSRRSSSAIKEDIAKLILAGHLHPEQVRRGSTAVYSELAESHMERYPSIESFESAVDRAMVDLLSN